MSIEQNIENLEIRNANVVTFVGTSSTMVDTISGRIQCKGFQHNSNVITDVSGPHGRGAAVLKKYPEIVFESGKFDSNDSTNTYVQAGYKVTVSGFVNTSNHPWKAFNGIDYEVGMLLSGLNYDTNGNANTSGTTASRLSASDSTPYGEWLKLELPNKIKLDKYVFTSRNHATHWSQSVEAGQVWGSNNDSDWEHLHTFTNSGFTGGSQTASFDVQTDNYYKYYAFIVTKTFAAGSDYYLCLPELKYYGYEEDPPAGDHSVDTTFKSRFNNPQLTGVQVFVDGKGSGSNQIAGGPTVTDTVESYDETGKYWNLTGELTSNISVEANTFLEGDQPHAVSVWFNSSNLEANVSNTCVFSIASEEKLDSVNLDLQSNTWHNLTYSYQGEGGSRVTYLDGRKVSEDQAEDTFGDYPPFAMTGYSQGGYVASASSEYIPTPQYQAWEAFNDITASDYDNWTSGDFYAGNGGDGTRSTVTWSGSTNHNGEFIKLELPHKLIVNYVKFEGRQGSTIEFQLPRAFTIIGSNDDVNWETIHQETRTTNPSSGEIHAMTGVSKHKGFKYIALVPKNSGTTNTNTHISIGNISYYGHRENDLVRLPDPTNVLKYPHIVTKNGTDAAAVNFPTHTGPPYDSYAMRGHVIKASESIAGYPAYAAFNGQTHVATGTVWVGGYNHYGTSHGNGTGGYGGGRNLKTDLGTGGSATSNGAWLYIEMPHKIKVTSTKIVSYDTSPSTGHPPENVIIYGTNDPSSSGGWNVVDNTYASSSSGIPNNTTGKSWAVSTASSPTAYKYFALVIVKVNNSGTLCHAIINDWQLIGTGVDSIPIQIGGGNIDKVANFRVYDKFVEEDQALEIWNAQKEEFGRAKPQMVLQQGKLGIGTDAPRGSLSVADELDPDTYGLQEFPPKPLVSNDTYIEGHGIFRITASSFIDTIQLGGNWVQNIYPWHAFNKTNTFGWVSTSSVYTNGLADSDSDNRFGILGEWLEIEMPSKIKLKHFTLSLGYDKTSLEGTNTSRFPKVFNLYKSNDGVTWTTPMEITTPTAPTQGAYGTTYTYNINENDYYSRYLIQVKQTHSNTSGYTTHSSHAAIGEWRLFGYREQVTKQSVLHDGQLTLTKNLNVPRIGPDIDSDNTPRRDRLVLEYNTSTNPTFDGAVRDTSGRGFDGIDIGGNRYNEDLKAFSNFTYGNYIRTNISLFRGNVPHSHSVWFRLTSSNGNWNTAINLGQNDGNGNQSAVTWDTGNNRLWLNTYNGGVYVQLTPIIGKWYHIVATNDGSGAPSNSTMKIYLDGVKQVTTDSGNGSGGSINVTGDYLTIGAGRTSSGNIQNIFNGAISNYKLYDIALTATEAKTLYDMGRCNEGHHFVNFSKTRVGIGLGDEEAPRAALEVKGDIIYSGMVGPPPAASATELFNLGYRDSGFYRIKGRTPITSGLGPEGDSVRMYCVMDPTWYGGKWMCFARINRGQSFNQVNIYTRTPVNGDPSNLGAAFTVPMSIMAVDSGNHGYDLDVMVTVHGGGGASSRGPWPTDFGGRVGAIWRGISLNNVFNETRGDSSYGPNVTTPSTSDDGITFTPLNKGPGDFQTSSGWTFTISADTGTGRYNDTNTGTGGWILHSSGSDGTVGEIYGVVKSATGGGILHGYTDWDYVHVWLRAPE